LYKGQKIVDKKGSVGIELLIDKGGSVIQKKAKNQIILIGTKAKPSTPDVDVNVPAGSSQAIAKVLVTKRGWDNGQFKCLVALWNRESGWRINANNPYSGAYGIPQALPGSKLASAGSDWKTNPKTQIKWGLGYIAGRYGTPCSAWEHSNSSGWY
jgi:hypothetical protein